MPIKDFIHHYPRALFNDIPRVGAHFYDIPGPGRTFTTYLGRNENVYDQDYPYKGHPVEYVSTYNTYRCIRIAPIA